MERALPATSYSCTSGFLSRNTSGTWYMMTAGHCVDQSNGGDRYQNTYTSSGSQTRIRIFNVPSTGWSINGRVDGARGWIPDLAVWNPSRWVWYTVNAEAYQIHHKIGSLSSIAIGALVCRGGGPSLSDCGEVTDNSDQRQIDWGSPTGTKTAYLAYAEGICTRDGDSGGPVFSVQSNGDVQAATAYGIASTSNDGTSCSGTTTDILGFSPSYAIEAALSIQVWCGGPDSSTMPQGCTVY